MAKCAGDCSSFTPSASTEWFKISELGEKEPGTPNTWVQGDINGGAPVNITMPSTIAAGSYLMRHEIIALQNSQSPGGAEYYPSCLQVTVSGSETGTPNSSINFPGAYKETDPGLLGNVRAAHSLYSMLLLILYHVVLQPRCHVRFPRWPRVFAGRPAQ